MENDVLLQNHIGTFPYPLESSQLGGNFSISFSILEVLPDKIVKKRTKNLGDKWIKSDASFKKIQTVRNIPRKITFSSSNTKLDFKSENQYGKSTVSDLGYNRIFSCFPSLIKPALRGILHSEQVLVYEPHMTFSFQLVWIVAHCTFIAQRIRTESSLLMQWNRLFYFTACPSHLQLTKKNLLNTWWHM